MPLPLYGTPPRRSNRAQVANDTPTERSSRNPSNHLARTPPRRSSRHPTSWGYLPRAHHNVARDVAQDRTALGYVPTMPYQPLGDTIPRPSRPPRPARAHRPQYSLAYSAGSEPLDHDDEPHGKELYEARIAMQYNTKDIEQDDFLHDPKRREFLSCDPFSIRGWANATALVLVLFGTIGFFAAYPIVSFWRRTTLAALGGHSYGLGGINGTGQSPAFPNMRTLVDLDTPQSAYQRTGFDGNTYELVFSDEFNHDGRTFWPGDDPFWTAVDLHYWPTGDYEWYDPDAVTTRNGSLVITMTKESLHNLNYRSGMLQSWNQFCFTGGYIEVSVSLPGVSTIPGFWPGAWTMGNLGRAAYGASTDGLWPYSYDSCDVGTMKNQTNLGGTTPAAALTTGAKGGELSYQPGQRLSACTCPSSASEHPGPNVNVGRGAPEIDILEAQIAPYDAAYTPVQAGMTLYNTQTSFFNSYKGGTLQQALSAVTATQPAAYTGGGGQFASYGFEYSPSSQEGFITWQANGQQTWTLHQSAIGPNAQTQVGQRLISEEPMYMILNFGMSQSFETVDFAALPFPAEMHIDYVRVYQREGKTNVGCDPPNYPTAAYINRYAAAYTNPNLTTWAQAGYSEPVNRLQNGGTCP